MLSIDAREPIYLRTQIERAASDCEIQTKVEMLESGDFVFSGKYTVSIERKVCDGDLLSSLANGRLQHQMAQILTSADISILGIEGTPVVTTDGYLVRDYNQKSGWKWTSVCGMLTSIQKMGIYVHWIPKPLFPDFVLSQIKYWEKDKHTSLVNPPKPFPSSLSDNSYDNKKRVLMCLPGIGSDLADKILYKFDKNLGYILSNPDALTIIDGIGKEKLSRIKELLNV